MTTPIKAMPPTMRARGTRRPRGVWSGELYSAPIHPSGQPSWKCRRRGSSLSRSGRPVAAADRPGSEQKLLGAEPCGRSRGRKIPPDPYAPRAAEREAVARQPELQAPSPPRTCWGSPRSAWLGTVERPGGRGRRESRRAVCALRRLTLELGLEPRPERRARGFQSPFLPIPR